MSQTLHNSDCVPWVILLLCKIHKLWRNVSFFTTTGQRHTDMWIENNWCHKGCWLPLHTGINPKVLLSFRCTCSLQCRMSQWPSPAAATNRGTRSPGMCKVLLFMLLFSKPFSVSATEQVRKQLSFFISLHLLPYQFTQETGRICNFSALSKGS